MIDLSELEPCDVKHCRCHNVMPELLAEIKKLRATLEEIVKDMPNEEPTRNDWNGNPDDDYESGWNRGAYFLQKIAKEVLK